MAALEIQPGQEVLVLTSMGWVKGVVYQVRITGNIEVEIEKVRRGGRMYLPKAATTIFPHAARYSVTVKNDSTVLRDAKRPFG